MVREYGEEEDYGCVFSSVEAHVGGFSISVCD